MRIPSQNSLTVLKRLRTKLLPMHLMILETSIWTIQTNLSRKNSQSTPSSNNLNSQPNSQLLATTLFKLISSGLLWKIQNQPTNSLQETTLRATMSCLGRANLLRQTISSKMSFKDNRLSNKNRKRILRKDSLGKFRMCLRIFTTKYRALVRGVEMGIVIV